MKKKKLTWNAGQTAERYTRPRLPPYTPLPDVNDPELLTAWDSISVGDILLSTEPHFIRHETYYKTIPHPMMVPGDVAWGAEKLIPTGASMIYIGTTNVDCQASKGRVISIPYPTVFYDGARYLIQNPNHFKPLV